MNREMPYRSDIDGLRAIAVLAVIAFHLNEDWLRGGFLGVDVFFVISGYLITGIVNGKLRNGTFALVEFWKRRIRRLYPAMLAMVGIVLIVGALVSVAPFRSRLPLQAAGAIFSFENILLWRTTTGYWAPGGTSIPLLHAWSLSLEEQFYVFFPPLLIFTFSFFRRYVTVVLAAVLAASFGLCLWGTTHYQSATFYLLPTRMWELLIGGLLALLGGSQKKTPEWASETLPLFGLGLIAASFLLIENNQSFPGYLPLFPCIGTGLIIHFNRKENRLSRYLTSPPLIYVGLISYSLYLWHWPVIVYGPSLVPDPHPAFLLAVTGMLSVASYHLVERPLRYRPISLRVVIPSFLLFLGLGFFLVTFYPTGLLIPKDSLPAYSKAESTLYDAKSAIRTGADGAVLTGKVPPTDICIIGSSHGVVLSAPIVQFAKKRDLSVLSMAVAGLSLVDESPQIFWRGWSYRQFTTARLEAIRRAKPRVTLVFGRWVGELEETGSHQRLRRVLESISESSEQTLVMGQIPELTIPSIYSGDLIRYYVASTIWRKSVEIPALRAVDAANDQIAAMIKGLNRKNVSYVDPGDFLRDKNNRVKVVRDGQFLYLDSNHVAPLGADYIFDLVLRDRLSTVVPASRPTQ